MKGAVDERFSLADTGLSCAAAAQRGVDLAGVAERDLERGQEVQHHAGDDRDQETGGDERSPGDPLAAGLQGCAPPAHRAAA